VEGADGLYREALGLAEELGMRPLGAQLRLGLGTACGRAQRIEAARFEISTATDHCRSMEMTLWLVAASAALGSLGELRRDPGT
jgi:hypothetical protein